eukprot:Filipodium_phascolosomae@DN5372_c0_g1_i1.p3
MIAVVKQDPTAEAPVGLLKEKTSALEDWVEQERKAVAALNKAQLLDTDVEIARHAAESTEVAAAVEAWTEKWKSETEEEWKLKDESVDCEGFVENLYKYM